MNKAGEALLEAFHKQADKLIRKHWSDIMEKVDKHENSKASVGISWAIDMSEPTAVSTAKLNIPDSIRDSATEKLDDPHQPNLIDLNGEAPKESKPKGKRGRPSKAREEETVIAPEEANAE